MSDTLFINGIYENDTLGIFNYKWYFGNGDSSNLRLPKVKYADTGSYIITLIVTDTNNNQDTLREIAHVTDSCRNLKTYTGQKEVEDSNKILIFPNPSEGIFNIFIKEDEAVVSRIEIHSLLGTLLYKSIQNQNKFKIYLKNLTKGLYLIKINYNNNEYINKIIIN